MKQEHAESAILSDVSTDEDADEDKDGDKDEATADFSPYEDCWNFGDPRTLKDAHIAILKRRRLYFVFAGATSPLALPPYFYRLEDCMIRDLYLLLSKEMLTLKYLIESWPHVFMSRGGIRNDYLANGCPGIRNGRVEIAYKGRFLCGDTRSGPFQPTSDSQKPWIMNRKTITPFRKHNKVDSNRSITQSNARVPDNGVHWPVIIDWLHCDPLFKHRMQPIQAQHKTPTLLEKSIRPSEAQTCCMDMREPIR